MRFDLYGGSNGFNGTFRMDDFVLNGFTTAVEEWRPMGYRYQGSEKDDEVKREGHSNKVITVGAQMKIETFKVRGGGYRATFLSEMKINKSKIK